MESKKLTYLVLLYMIPADIIANTPNNIVIVVVEPTIGFRYLRGMHIKTKKIIIKKVKKGKKK